MSRHFSQQEENFWPCVSDMFLALFIIALTLYATKGKMGSGDLMVEDQQVQETIVMLKELQEAFPGKGFDKLQQEISDEHEEGKSCGKRNCSLCRAIDRIPRTLEVQEVFGTNVPDDAENTGKEHRDAFEYLYKYVKGVKETPADIGDLRLVREVHQEVTFRLIAAKQNRLGDLEKENKGLVSTVNEIKVDLDKSKENEKKLEEQLGKDMRPLIMKEVASKFKELERAGMVQIEENEGFMRIPSKTLTFKGGQQKQEDQVLDNRANPQNEANMRKIADALYAFMEEDQKRHWVDTIVIEGHASKDVRKGSEWANELVSIQRAIGTWILLNKHHNFEEYKNSDGKMIIGYAGFGSHNLLEPRESESEEQYNERCRRIDIRFIPAAVRK